MKSQYSWMEGFVFGVLSVLFILIIVRLNDDYFDNEQPASQDQYVPLTENDVAQIQCLAENAYFEAGNQSEEGKLAVTNVVMNRLKDDRFPKTPCDVIYERVKGVCQFSWVCKDRRSIGDIKQYKISYRVARDVYLNQREDNTMGANFYHADYVRPGWASRFMKTVKIQNHIFYQG